VLAWILMSALAAEPTPAPAPAPSGEFDLSRLDDPGAWHTRSRVLLDGPPGCIEVQGRVRLQVSLYSAGSLLSTGGRRDIVGEGRFEGRLSGGTWTRLNTTWVEAPEGDSVALEVDRFRPIVGRLPPRDQMQTTPRPTIEERYTEDEIVIPPDLEEAEEDGTLAITKGPDGLRVHIDGGGDAALGMLDEIIDDIDPSGTSVYVTWDPDAKVVQMTESVPFDHGDDAMEILVHFPNGEAPTRLDATFPKRMKLREDGMAFTIRDAQLHLRSRQTELGVVPGVEGMSVVVGMMGFTAGIDQRVSYDRVRACPGG